MNITGRVTVDAQVRNVSNSKTVVNFSVAINDSYKNKAGERIEQTTYFDCAYWLSATIAILLFIIPFWQIIKPTETYQK